jgi:hypothetical protein
MKLVVLITAEVEKGLDVAQAWQDAGAPGVTIIRSYGLYTLQSQVKSGAVELPMMIGSMAAAMAHIIDSVEENVGMILSLVSVEMVDKLIAAASAVLGDLTEPNHGVLFVVPVERALGLPPMSRGGER